MNFWSKRKSRILSQLEFPLAVPSQPDRNHFLGGRSFYFFDFDDNVAFLPTDLFLFHRKTGEEKVISTQDFSLIASEIGKSGVWKDFEVRQDPVEGSFRRFRHHHLPVLARIKGRQQPIIEDIRVALKQPIEYWKGPSWEFFRHAVHNQRPVSIITARGHRPETVALGIREFVHHGHLTTDPNYLAIYPVNDLKIRAQLGDASLTASTAELKRRAILQSVEEAFRHYGQNPAHRFGMSDDDKDNIEMIIAAMQELKRKYPENSFFVIETHRGRLTKWEVESVSVNRVDQGREQLPLF